MMQPLHTDEVFGVSNNIIQTYVERDAVDTLFIQGLQTNKHLVVYGASKQGKTSLTKRHISSKEAIRINCSPLSTPYDLYKSIFRQLNTECQILDDSCMSVEDKAKAMIKANLRKMFPDPTHSSDHQNPISGYNLALAQDVSEILNKIHFDKRIIIENFHYLSPETQKQLCSDLRVFDDHHIRFIILGIWRDKNRLIQHNDDLSERVLEISVDPWKKDDLKQIIYKGEFLLNVSFTHVLNQLLDASFHNVGVFQELCKQSCIVANVTKTSDTLVEITKENMKAVIEKKLRDYSIRHSTCMNVQDNSNIRSLR